MTPDQLRLLNEYIDRKANASTALFLKALQQDLGLSDETMDAANTLVNQWRNRHV